MQIEQQLTHLFQHGSQSIKCFIPGPVVRHYHDRMSCVLIFISTRRHYRRRKRFENSVTQVLHDGRVCPTCCAPLPLYNVQNCSYAFRLILHYFFSPPLWRLGLNFGQTFSSFSNTNKKNIELRYFCCHSLALVVVAPLRSFSNVRCNINSTTIEDVVSIDR